MIPFQLRWACLMEFDQAFANVLDKMRDAGADPDLSALGASEILIAAFFGFVDHFGVDKDEIVRRSNTDDGIIELALRYQLWLDAEFQTDGLGNVKGEGEA